MCKVPGEQGSLGKGPDGVGEVPVATYEESLRVVAQAQQTVGDSTTVLIPLPSAENHLGEVPHPADDGHVGQLLLGHDFGSLKQGGVTWLGPLTADPTGLEPKHGREGIDLHMAVQGSIPGPLVNIWPTTWSHSQCMCDVE